MITHVIAKNKYNENHKQNTKHKLSCRKEKQSTNSIEKLKANTESTKQRNNKRRQQLVASY